MSEAPSSASRLNAVVSARAGVAILVQPDGLSSIHVDSIDDVVPRSLSDVRLLLGDARDLQFMEGVEIAAVRTYLAESQQRDSALHLVLILLDATSSADVRQDAARVLDELLVSPAAAEYLESVLYAHPLPADTGVVEALAIAGSLQLSHAGPLLQRLTELQDEITSVWTAWDAVPSAILGTSRDKRNFTATLVRAGVFRQIVEARSANASLDVTFADALRLSAPGRVEGAEPALRKWQALLARLPARTPAKDEPGDSRWGEQVRHVATLGRAAWPKLSLSLEDLSRYLRDRFEDDRPIPEQLIPDLYLACACVLAVPGAVETFSSAMLSTLPQRVASIGGSPDFLAMVRERLLETLFVSKPEAPAKIASYSGRGPLAGWVAVAATRVALQLARRRGVPSDAHDDRRFMMERLVGERGGELAPVRAAFAEALEQAIRDDLSASERLLLRLALVKNVSVRRIASIHNVDESVIVRRIERCKRALVEGARARLAKSLRVPEEDLFGSALDSDVSLSRLLGSDSF
jgi:RNA polymerase sigma-70 factor, ECF subfamily